MLDIFKNDMFTVMALTAAIQNVPYVPRRVQELGWFEEDGVTSTSVVIEMENNTLHLVEDKPRGSPPKPVSSDKRSGIPFVTNHLPQNAAIMADEIIGVREFGSEDALQSVQAVLNKRLEKMRRNLDATIEYHRIGALKGLILDADGSTVLHDLFARFGLAQQSVDMLLTTSTTKVRAKALEIQDKIEDALQGWSHTGVRTLCGRQFWEDLITHPKVEETYLNYESASRLRGDVREEFEFGGIMWERYRGTVNGQAYIGTDEAYAVPEGVSDLAITRFAPADYMEAVGTRGLPYYAKAEPMRMDKGVDLEGQSNPINLITRPRSVIKLNRVSG